MLDHTRHFVLLLAMAAGLGGASWLAAVLTPGLIAPGELLSASGIVSQFAMFGALHAIALVRSLTTRLSVVRQITLIGAATAVSAATASLTLMLVRRISNLTAGPVPILITAAALGAWAYAGTIGCVLRVSLGARFSLWISLGCGTAVAAAYPWVKHHPGAAGLGLAIPWWLAFSIAFALQDPRRRR